MDHQKMRVHEFIQQSMLRFNCLPGQESGENPSQKGQDSADWDDITFHQCQKESRTSHLKLSASQHKQSQLDQVTAALVVKVDQGG